MVPGGMITCISASARRRAFLLERKFL